MRLKVMPLRAVNKVTSRPNVSGVLFGSEGAVLSGMVVTILETGGRRSTKKRVRSGSGKRIKEQLDVDLASRCVNEILGLESCEVGV